MDGYPGNRGLTGSYPDIQHVTKNRGLGQLDRWIQGTKQNIKILSQAKISQLTIHVTLQVLITTRVIMSNQPVISFGPLP
jgi:hypothetical protein